MMKHCLSLFMSLFVFFVTAGFADRDSDLVAHWTFDEPEGDIVRDVSGNEHQGTIIGTVIRTQGVQGNALSFDGEKENFVRCGSPEDFRFSRAFTIMAWVRRSDAGTLWDGIVCFGGGGKGYQVFYGERTQSLALYLNSDQQGYGPVAGGYVPLDEWMHLAVVFDASSETVRIYQNGHRTARQVWKGMIAGFPEEIYIGRSEAFSAFRGAIDEVKIYRTALSEEAILKEYRRFSELFPARTDGMQPCFENLTAEITAQGVLLQFKKTDSYAGAIAGQNKDIQVSIRRNHCRLNDRSPGFRNGQTIFEGILTSPNGIDYEYLDTEPLAPGQSHFYWVTPDGINFRIYPAKIRARHPEIWWNQEKIERKIDELARLYPNRTKIVKVGKTVQGRPLRALLAGNPERRIVLIGSIHVSESGPELILPAVERLLKENSGLLEQIGIAALPCVNQDERERLISTGYPLYLRKNAQGVDLNRNFDSIWDPSLLKPGAPTEDPQHETYRGPSPGSEPETQALCNLLRQSSPAAVLSFHSVNGLTNAGFLYPANAEIEDNTGYVQQCREYASIYANGMYGPEDAAKYFWFRPSGYQGTLNSWVYKEFEVPAFDLELDDNPKTKIAIPDGVTPELLEEFQGRHYRALVEFMRAIASGK